MKTLDFIIIGAQKSATTALYSYLNDHPQIAMPSAKEAPFFDADECGPDAWAEFSRRHFPAADARLWGKASPQYMSHPLAAERIAGLMPATRLIAILRDPVDRAWSHYQMERRRELESRSFDEAVSQLLMPANLRAAREKAPPRHTAGYESEADFYLTWGEYGRILEPYREHFDREQILVLTTRQLKEQPAAMLDQVLAFIGLAPGYRPPNLGAVVHRGGGAPLVSVATRQRLISLRLLRWAWNSIPEEKRGLLRFWFEQRNVRRGAPELMQLNEGNRRRLRQHFAVDAALLEQRLGVRVPWSKIGPGADAVANCNRDTVAKCDKVLAGPVT